MFVIDGVAVYKRRNRAGGLYALEVIDAATIKLLMDDSGRLPASPDPAYQQVLKGVPAADYTRDELMYLVHNPRSHKVYGYSHVEQVLVSVNILIRRSLHQLEYYREGSTPDALIGLPKEWTSEQIGSFQKHFDAMLSGNLGLRRRVRFMPGDFKYQETKAPPLKDAYDEFLARIVCFVFSISPEPFVGQVNRATAESSQARATDEGLAPLMRFVRGFMNRIIAQEFNSPDLEFAWTEQRAQDPMEAAQIDVAYVGAGVLTVDEVRANMGLAPLATASANAAHVTPVLKFNPNHLGTGPGGGRFTTAGTNGTSLGLEPGSGEARWTEIDLKAVAQSALKPAGLPSWTQVAADDREQSDTRGVDGYDPDRWWEHFSTSVSPGIYLPVLPEGLFGDTAASVAAPAAESGATTGTGQAAATGAVIPGYTATESKIINEAQTIIDSPQYAQLQAAAKSGQSVVVNIEGRQIQYVPGMPSSGMSDFGQGGFFMGPEAFKSTEEAQETVLHELHRLYTTESSNGVSGELATSEADAASNFAKKAFKELKK